MEEEAEAGTDTDGDPGSSGVSLEHKINEWCFRPQFCMVRLYITGTIWANDMNFVKVHAPGAGLMT